MVAGPAHATHREVCGTTGDTVVINGAATAAQALGSPPGGLLRKAAGKSVIMSLATDLEPPAPVTP